MKYILQTVLAFGLLYSCHPDKNRDIIRLATEFTVNTLDSAKVYTDSSGIVTVGDFRARYVINFLQIFRGRIEEYSEKSVWVTIDSLHDPYLVPLYHLILSEEQGKLTILDTIRSDIRVLKLSNGIITADIPTHLPESPLYYCEECRDTVEYRVSGGKLIRVFPK